MNYAFLVYRLKDGRYVGFNARKAIAERKEAISGWQLSPEFMATVDRRYDAVFGQPAK